MSIEGAPINLPVPREIVGGISAVFNGGDGPSAQHIDSAMDLSGIDPTKFTGNKSVRVRGALTEPPAKNSWALLDELIHITRDQGYFGSPPLPRALVQLQAAIALHGGNLTDDGFLTWGTPVGDAIRPALVDQPAVEPPRASLTSPTAGPPPLASRADLTTPAHERLLWLLRRVPQSFTPLVARRRSGHDPLKLRDEYDLQDATEVALRLLYNDVRPEERTPSYGGSSTTQDFLLFEVKTMVEIKVTRHTPFRGNVKIREEIDVDSMAYLAHPNVERMVFVVYDIAATITNPRGFEHDLSTPINGRNRDTLVVSWPYPN